jgi:hypothetical protein
MFTGREVQEISFEAGSEMTARYREYNPEAIQAGYLSKDAVVKLLNQKDCVGIKIYFAEYEEREMTMVIVGVTSNENDQIGNGYSCMNNLLPCPQRCGENNMLNSDV